MNDRGIAGPFFFFFLIGAANDGWALEGKEFPLEWVAMNSSSLP